MMHPVGLREARALLAACIALHAAAGAALLARILPALHDALASSRASAHALSLEPALRRFTMLCVALPPVAACLTGLAVWAALGPARRRPAVAPWLAVGCVPLAFDAVARAVHAWSEAAPSSAGEVLDWLLTSPLSFQSLVRSAGGALAPWLSALVGDVGLADLAAVACWSVALVRAHRGGVAPPAGRPLPATAMVLGLQVAAAVAVGRFGPAVTQAVLLAAA